MKSIFSGLLIGLAGIVSAQPAFVKDSLDVYVNREMKRWNIPALAVAIVKDGKVVACKGYGTTESNGTKKVDENTLFQIASNSKAFTGTSLAMLDARKKISLDDKATKWLPYFSLKEPYASKEVTVRDLLCHRIGFQTFQSDFLNWNCNLTRKEIIEGMKNVTPVYSFRSRYGYCNSAFLAAGEVIKAATDTTWDDFVKYNFFKPLSMTRSTTYHKDIVADQNAAVPYTILRNKLVKLDYANVDNLGPAASISSCVKDMSNWVLCQLDSGRFNGRQVIPFAAIKTTRTPQMIAGRGGNNPDFPSNHFNLYGMGWGIKDYYGKAMYEHTGGADGFVTSVCLFPEEKLGIVVLTNTDMNDLFLALREQIMLAYFNQPYKNLSAEGYKYFAEGNKEANAEIDGWMNKTKVKDQEFPLAKDLVGKYNNEVYGDVEVKNDEGLVVTFSHHPQAKGKLSYMGDNTFLCEYTYATWGFQQLKVKVENNKVSSIIIKVNDFVDYMDYEFKKK
jgi:CubicO group peptidase (beta-lactamase class C family)